MAFGRRRGVRILLVLTLLLAFGVGAGGAFIYYTFLQDLPDLQSVADYRPPLASTVLDREGRPIAVFAKERRVLVPLEGMPEYVPLAFVSAEDAAFFEHSGIDYVSIVRAAWVDLRAGGIKQGASTITMQLVKQLLLSPERRWSRKIREMVLATQIEQHFSKQEILYLYLNQIYFGGGAWGIGEAAHTYFDKPASELTVGESALLAGLPQRPSDWSPFRNPDSAERRRLYVLGRMLDEGHIDQATYDDAVANPPLIASSKPNPDFWTSVYFTEEVRRYLVERLGEKELLEGGLVVETTMDVDLQRAAVASLRKGLDAYDKRRGYRGPLRQVAPDGIAAELELIAAENRLAVQEDGNLPELPIGVTKVGIVVEVDSEAKWARIAFAPGIDGQAALEDVSWAREADIKKRPRPVKRIEAVFQVGDVAQFRRLEGEPLVPIDGEEETEEKATAAAAEEGEELEPGEDGEDAPAKPALARVDIYQVPEAESAIISMEIATGDVTALVGGYDYARSQFNRATQALRQPGSAFKPFIYGAALSREYTPVSTLWDRPVVYTDPVSGFVWHPENYSKHFYGQMPLRQALVRSVNNATVHLFRDVGVDYVIDYARRLGIQAPLNRDLSLALGSSAVGLTELTTAYAVFPNRGKRVTPRFIKRVTDRSGQVILEDVVLGNPPPPVLKPLGDVAAGGVDGEPGLDEDDPNYPDAEILPTEQIISEEAAFLMCDLLQAVVKDPRGTGWRLRDLGRPLGGKTGTTNDQNDAWFMGFSPDIVTGVWVGRDDNVVLGWSETGSRAAAPIWIDYMRAALAPWPIREFEEPENIVKIRIDRGSGLIADATTDEAYFQPFLEGTEPEETATGRQRTIETRRAIREDIF